MIEYAQPVITESGRVIKFSRDPKADAFILELIDGAWVKPIKPISFDDDWHSRVLSDDELQAYLAKSEAP